MAKRTTKKTEPFTIRLDPDVREGLDKVASDIERSLSWVVNRALAQWLDGKGLDRAKLRREL